MGIVGGQVKAKALEIFGGDGWLAAAVAGGWVVGGGGRAVRLPGGERGRVRRDVRGASGCDKGGFWACWKWI